MKRFILSLLILMIVPATVFAQKPLTCEFDYTVQAGDWLSRIAEKYYGDPLAYDQIVVAANVSSDDMYTNVDNPDLIEPGWMLCIQDDGDPNTGPQPVPKGLSRDELASATYSSEWTNSGSAQLNAGVYSEPAAPGSATMTNIMLTDPIAYGELNGQPAAAVVLVTDPGGSGTFYTLHLMVNQDGQPVEIGQASLGDRIEVNGITVANNQVIIDMVQAGPDDPMCCPSQKVIKTFEMQGDQLVEVSSTPVEQPQPEADLAGPTWLLDTVTGQPVLDEAPVTAVFGEDGSLSGSSGCNNYSTTYTADGDSLTIDPVIAATMMACPEPIMQQEQAYLTALGATASYQINGDQLQLQDADGSVVASFSVQKPVELAGSSWQVIAYNNGKQGIITAIIGTELTANFGIDGSLNGSAGCNDYTTAYQTDGETISIGPTAVTQKFCAEPEGIMEQESQYLAALETATTYKIELNRMEMRTSDGALAANFEMMAPAAEASVSGTVTYLQRIALAPDAVVNVQLQDTSQADAPATVIGEQVIPANGQQVPIPFEITYDPSVIQDNHTYTLSVRIEDSGGKLLFINTTSYPVISNGNPTSDVEVIVEPVG